MQESNYDILGISEIASKKEIHEAFRRLALLHHADRGGNEEEFKKIKQSYDDIKQESGLQNMSNSELESEKLRQIKSEDLVNSRPGAMAMSQKKIRMFTKYSRMYIDKIDCELQVRAS